MQADGRTPNMMPEVPTGNFYGQETNMMTADFTQNDASSAAPTLGFSSAASLSSAASHNQFSDASSHVQSFPQKHGHGEAPPTQSPMDGMDISFSSSSVRASNRHVQLGTSDMMASLAQGTPFLQTNLPSHNPFHTQQYQEERSGDGMATLRDNHHPSQTTEVHVIPSADSVSTVTPHSGNEPENSSRFYAASSSPRHGTANGASAPAVTPPSRPTSLTQAPCQTLHAWLFDVPRRISAGNKDYITWMKPGKGDHEPHFSAVFVNPMTKEPFPCGRFGNPNDYCVEGDVVWYKKKKLAQHGTAARAYDCLTFREGIRTRISYSPICLEEPSGEPILLEGLVPSDILEKLRSMAPGI